MSEGREGPFFLLGLSELASIDHLLPLPCLNMIILIRHLADVCR